MSTSIDTDTSLKSAITLKGSAQLVSEFFYYGINSILYQRGVYPAETFKRMQQYGLTLLVTTDDQLDAFLKPLTEQIREWLESKELRKLVVVVSSVHSKEVLERWQFDIDSSSSSSCDDGTDTRSRTSTKSEKAIRQEISDVIRQITASITFLPMLEGACSFDVLSYTNKQTKAPDGFADSCAPMIKNAQEVQLRSFNTLLHKVDTRVQYRADDIDG